MLLRSCVVVTLIFRNFDHLKTVLNNSKFENGTIQVSLFPVSRLLILEFAESFRQFFVLQFTHFCLFIIKNRFAIPK